MRRVLLPMVVLVLLASGTALGSASLGSPIHTQADVRAGEPVKLRARAASPYLPCCDCPYGWWVDVIEVIEGPQVVGRLLVVIDATIAGPCLPGGTIDPSIAPGDEVEAFGLLEVDPSLGLTVSLCGSDGYYLRRVTSGPTPTPTATMPSPTLMAAKFVDKGQAMPGEELEYTLVVMNDILSGEDPGSDVHIVDPLPETLELVPGSLSPEATYDPDTRSILWQGQVSRGGSVTLGFRAVLTPASAQWRSVSNTMLVTDAFGRQVEASAQTHINLEPTPTETPPGDLTLSGLVHDATAGPSHPIAGATVSVLMCVPRSFPTTTEADGRYRLLLPGAYLNQCVEVTLQASASGYHSFSQIVSVVDLRAQPVRDIALQPVRYLVYLPLVVRNGP